MIKRYLLAGSLFLFTQFNNFSQDLALQAPFGSFSAPVTGCALTSTETVTVNIICNGVNLPAGTTFTVAYSVNGVPIGSDNVVLGSTLLASSVYTHTFTTPANLSVAGTYDFDATVTLTSVADINASNNTYSNYMVTNNAASVGGTVAGGGAVCNGANSGNVTLSGNTGNVLNWEYSTDFGFTWFNISNITTSQSYNNITTETWYRANVQNAGCAPAISDTAILTIDATTVGGTISGATNVCASGNSGTLTSGGARVGTVLDWEFSTTGAGGPYTSLGVAGNTYNFLNLLTTTHFRVLVQNGVCATAYSTPKVVNVNPVTDGGNISTPDTVCASGNGGTLTLAANVGGVIRWERSTDGGITWPAGSFTTTTATSLAYTNLTQTTHYRVRVQSTACAVDYSDTIAITVDAITDAGNVTSDATICSGTNAGTLTLAGNNGSPLNWESSTDGGATWTNIANTTTTENYLNLTGNTLYRVNVQNGVCAAAYSDTVTLTVDSVTLGGNLSSPATVCSGINSGSLSLSGERGTILNWEFSTDGVTWNNIPNNTNFNNYSNLNQTTYYRVQVENGVCSSTYSDTLEITVDSITVAGSVSLSTTVCAGNNSDTLNLSGHIGSVTQWEFSNDGFTWIPIVNTTTAQSYNNLNSTTFFRALVQSGVCPSANSTPATITVDPNAVGGNIIGSTTVCSSGNSGALTLVGFTNSVVDWEESNDGGLTFSSTGNSSITQNYTNLSQTTIYRAIVSSGLCPNDTSATATISVDTTTVGGLVTLDDTVCAGLNGDTLNLTGHTGSVVNWEMSTDNGTTWLTLSNTTTQQIYNNLLTTTLFRVRVQNGVCAAANSVASTITVNPQSEGGVVNSNTSGCEGFNSGIFTLTGEVGTIVQWESSTDGGTTWGNIPGVTTNTFNYSNLTDTTYIRVIVQSGSCTPDISSAAIFTAYPKPVASFVSDTACLNSDLVFVNTSTIANGGIVLNTWDFGDGSSAVLGSPTHQYSDTGNFTVTLVAMSNFSCLDTISQNARVLPLPDASIVSSNGTTFCAEGTTVLQAVIDPAYHYDWSTGDTTSSTIIDTTLDVTLLVTDTTSGCTNTNNIDIEERPAPVANAGLDTTLNLGGSILLMGSGGGSYLWSPGTTLSDSTIANPMASPIVTTDYILTVTNTDGCTDSDTVTVTVEEILNFYITNMITPNGDGFNDTWYIENIDLFPANEVQIFNRNGQVVFSMDSYDNTWGGTFNGSLLPDGTYYYVLTFTDSDQVFKGAINILNNK